MIETRRASGVFDDTETAMMREAYEMAVLALGLTHEIDDIVKAMLADCIVRILMTENIAHSDPRQNTSVLAARGLDRLLVTYNACVSGESKMRH